MPNHCYNTLTFCGPEQTLEQIKIDLGHIEIGEDNDGDPTTIYSPLHFNNLIPMPDDVSTDSSNENLPKWYIWRVDNWGTKWEPWATTCSLVDNMLTYTFITAWAEPQQIVEFLSEKYKLPTHHSYTEEFGQFSGIRVYQDGEEIINISADFDIPTAEQMMYADYAFDRLNIHSAVCPECGREKVIDHYSNTLEKAVCEDCCDECKQTNQGDN